MKNIIKLLKIFYREHKNISLIYLSVLCLVLLLTIGMGLKSASNSVNEVKEKYDIYSIVDKELKNLK